MDKQTWELVLYNTNHMNMAPHTIITTVCYDLVDHLMDTMYCAFKDNGYKSFKMMIVCKESGAIIRDERSA